MPGFTVEQARAFYDRFGRKQDWQRFYEDPAIDRLIEHAAFGQARRVLEFGCGTGRFAQRLLRGLLPAQCTYLGIDVSGTMVGIARQRLGEWPGRAEVRLSDGSGKLEQPDSSADRFVSNYVFDLLAPQQIASVLTQAHRVLVPDGLLCLVSLTHGRSLISRAVSRTWQRICALSPALVGGCRPLDLTEFLSPQWRIQHLESVASFGLTSQVLIASREESGQAPQVSPGQL
jgi:ubiquinone/menaquinone biosynthesis C-methylase UbiE